MISAFRALPRGAIAAAVGAAVIALAMVLPWISIPGGAFQREVMSLRGVPFPGTGPAWRSLPLLSVLLAGVALIGIGLAFLTATAHKLRLLAAGATSGYGAVVLVALIDRLFADRVASEYTAVGAGGYLGLVGVVTVTLGALVVIRDVRVGRRPTPAGGRPSPLGEADATDRHREVAARSWIWTAAAGVTILVAYLATRLSFADRFPYFVDEALWADHADQVARSRDKLFVALSTGQGPSLSWFGAVWVKLGFAPLTAVRLVSVGSGLLTVGVVGLLARSLWGTTVGWVAAGLCVVIPLFLVHDGIGIYEPLVTLIMASALLLQIMLARRPDFRIAALLGAVLATGVLTKQNTLPALTLLPISLLCFDFSESGRRRRLTTWLLGVALVIAMVGAADLLQRSSSYYGQREAVTESILLWPARSTTDVLNDPFGVIGPNWETYRPALIGYLTVPLLVTTLAGAVLGWRARPRPTAVLLAWILVPFAVGMLFQLRPFPRHAMFLVPPAVVLSAYAIVQASRLAQRTLPRAAATFACLVGVALVLTPAVILDWRVLAHPATARYPGLDYWQYVAGWPAGGPWREAADLIRRRADDGQVVILAPGSYGVLSQSLGDRYVFESLDSPLAARAQFGVLDTAGFPVDPKGFGRKLADLQFAPIGRFERPRGPCSGPREPACGGAVIVFERR